jgi:hypothetical protein
MKSFLRCFFFLIFCALSTSSFSQVVGDYRSFIPGSAPETLFWTNRLFWERWSGTAWIMPTESEGYPGQNASPETVTIQSGHTITLNVSPSNYIQTLHVIGGLESTGDWVLSVRNNLYVDAEGAVVFGGNSTLTVSGNFSVDPASNFTFSGSAYLILEDDITISSDFEYTVESNMELSSLTVPTGVSFTFAAPVDLTVREAVQIEGAFIDNNVFGVNTFQGPVTVTPDGSWNTQSVTNPINLIFQNGVSSSGTSFQAGAATFNTNNQSISGTTSLNFNNAINVSGVSLTNNGTLTLANTGAGTLSGTGTFIQGVNSTLNYSGATITINGLTASASGNTVNYNAAGGQTIFNASGYHHLTISGSNTKALSSNILLNGNLSVEGSAVLGVGAFGVTIGGSSNQQITGSTTFNNLTVSKSSGDVILGGTASTVVNGTLSLQTGNIQSSAAHTLSLGTSAIVNGGSATSFVSGPMNKIMTGSSSFAFPTGENGRYRPATVANTSGNDTWSVEYIEGDFSSTAFNALTIGTVSKFEYWEVSRTGSTIADLTLSYNVGSYNSSGIGSVANLRVVHWDGTQWDLPSSTTDVVSQSGSTITGSVTIQQVTSFSPFTIGSTDTNSPLPVTWLSFYGTRLNKQGVLLKWKTATEENNDRFEIERSENGSDFNRIATIQGSGNSKTPLDYQFIDAETSDALRYYYRLRQVDLDGKDDYSKVIVVLESVKGNQWFVSQNPSDLRNSLKLIHYGPSNQPQKIMTALVTSTGGVIFKEEAPIIEINAKIQHHALQCAPGIYILKVSDGNSIEYFRIVL